MEIKPGYKQTEIGVIPEDWVVENLRELVTIRSGESPSNYTIKTTGIPFFKVDQLNNSNKYQKDTPYYIDVIDPIPAGSIVFPKRGAAIFMNKVRILDQDSYIDTNIMSLTPNYRIYNELLYYILTHIDISSLADTTSVPQINNKHIYPCSIVFPPDLKEQMLISGHLSDIDFLITSLEKLIEKKKLIKQGVMQELLTGKKRLPGFSREWETKRLGDSLVFERPDKYIYWGKELKPQGAIPVLTANKSFILGYANEYAGVYNDVPAIIFDDFTTDCKYVRFPFKVKSSAIKILKPANHDVDLRFIFYTMQSTKFSIGDHKRYYISEYQHLKISLPKIDEQAAIADVIEDIEIEIDLRVKQLNKQILLKQAMMQELLTGRIRLI